MRVQYYHNPACSKSRQGLATLQARGIEVELVSYLQQPPSVEELDRLLQRLGMDDPRQLMRQQEAEYSELGLAEASLSRAHLLAAMVAHPRLIERPIVVCGEQALVARPSERLDPWLDALLGASAA